MASAAFGAFLAGSSLRVEVDDALFAEVDDTALDRILSNLVSNAIKFTPPGGEVVVTGTGEGPNVVFTKYLRDTGVRHQRRPSLRA